MMFVVFISVSRRHFEFMPTSFDGIVFKFASNQSPHNATPPTISLTGPLHRCFLGLKKFEPAKLRVKKVWVQNIFIDFLAEVDLSKKYR